MVREASYTDLVLEGRYRLLADPIYGSYALLFKAEDLNARAGEPNVVMVKVLCPEVQGRLSTKLVAKLTEFFEQETRILAQSDHVNVVKLLAAGDAQDSDGRTFSYQVLEYLAGGTLEDLCRRKPLTIEEAVEYLSQIVAALEHLYSLGVIDRDIKPDNLLLTADGKTVKIADLGVARLKDDAGVITNVGSNTYAPPEHSPLLRKRSEGRLTQSSDVYSLAKSFYRFAGGERPDDFGGKQITDLPHSIAYEPWSNELLKVIMKATQDDPSLRQQSPSEFLRDVRAALSSAEPETHKSAAASATTNAATSATTNKTTSTAKKATTGTTKTAAKAGATDPSPRPPKAGANFVAASLLGLLHILVGAHARLLMGIVVLGALAAAVGLIKWRGRDRYAPVPKVVVTLDNFTPTKQTPLEGLTVVPFENIDVHLRAEPGSAKKRICAINSKARVEVLGDAKLLGKEQEKWFPVQVIEPGEAGDKNCRAGDRGWAYGKKFLVPQN